MAPTMSQAAPRRPPWLDGRTRRSGAQRRAQDMRAEARMVQRLLKCFAQLQHRGCGSTALGQALAMALQPSVAEAPSEDAAAAAVIVAPERPPGTFYAKAHAAPATTDNAQPAQQPIHYSTDMIPVPLRATSVDVDYFLEVNPVPLRATRQPSVKAELYQLFIGEVEFVDLWVSKGAKPSTQNGKQRFDRATSAIEILNLIVSHESANG